MLAHTSSLLTLCFFSCLYILSSSPAPHPFQQAKRFVAVNDYVATNDTEITFKTVCFGTTLPHLNALSSYVEFHIYYAFSSLLSHPLSTDNKHAIRHHLALIIVLGQMGSTRFSLLPKLCICPSLIQLPARLLLSTDHQTHCTRRTSVRSSNYECRWS